MRLLAAFLFAASLSPAALSAQSLTARIVAISAQAKGKVQVACSLPGVSLDCSVNAHAHPPMQSAFKLPLALAVLRQVESGKLLLDQKVHFAQSDLEPGSYSPLQDAHPHADADISIRELVTLSAGQSDNVATDILLRVLGGPPAVQTYLNSIGLGAIHVRDSERTMHADESLQYRNDAEPAAFVLMFRMLADHSPLNTADTALLLSILRNSNTGPGRLRAGLPPGTVLEHKTGTSGTFRGMLPATNDAGLITLPSGHKVALAVFVTDAHADQDTCDHVIAQIAKVVFEEAIHKDAPKR